MGSFRVQQIDHVELFAPDQYEAARWYRETLGLEIVAEFEHWADGGPLMVRTPDAGTMVAIFAGDPPRHDPPDYRRLAFRTSGDGFLAFLEQLEGREVYDLSGAAIATPSPVDHGGAFSVYFHDPWGHPLEVTTYDAGSVREALT